MLALALGLPAVGTALDARREGRSRENLVVACDLLFDLQTSSL